MNQATNTTYEAVADRIREATRITLLTHGKPDGDALGSVVALHRALSSLGKSPATLLVGPLATNLMAMAGPTPCTEFVEKQDPPETELIIVADTSARSQLEPLTGWVEASRAKAIVLDHHVNGDDIADLKIVDPGCASATQVIMPLLDELGVGLTGGPFGIAEALLMGLATDTGWFRYSNADARAFRDAARLIEAGADKSRIFATIEENDRMQRYALKARALGSLELFAAGQAAVMSLRPEDFTETGATVGDMVGLVNEPMSIGSVRVSVLVTSPEGSLTKLSFRSKPPVEGADGVRVVAVDVNRLAGAFNGGGHVHAAGGRVEEPLEVVRARLVTALDAEFAMPA